MPRIVILGAGFAGMQAAIELDRLLGRDTNTEVLLVDQGNHFLFTPLLPQIPSSYTNPRHIVQPVRDIRGGRRFRFRRDTARSIHPTERRVECTEGELSYDALIVALGSRSEYFNVPGARQHSFDFKTLEHAVELREHVIDACEHADHSADEAERRRLLTLVVVGGGYTGVELIAELQDFMFGYVARRYRGISRQAINLFLLEAGDRMLRGLDRSLARHARERLDAEGITVRTRARVTRCTPQGIEINGSEFLESDTVVWSAGVRAHELVEALPGPHDRRGRSMVNEFLQLEGCPEVFIVGDSAVAESALQAPQIAPVAMEQGRLAARNLLALRAGRAMEPYRYQKQGMLVSLGMNHAVVSLMGLKFRGYLAWLFWNAVHLLKLVGLKRQLQVALDWSLATVFPRDSTIVRRPRNCPYCQGGAGESLTRVEPTVDSDG